AFFSFCFISSAIYIINDIFDVEKDKLHPIKKLRPLASGKISYFNAILATIVFILASFYLSLPLGTLFSAIILFYFLIQILYSISFKNFAITDILIIASGFVLRVYAGAFAINAHLSVWFLLCVISVALFLASGKRRAEIGILPEGKTRTSLTKYKSELLNSYVTMFGNAAWMSWALYTFFESPTPSTQVWLILAEISRTTTVSKLTMVTIPVVIYIIMRYEALIFENRSEAPEKLFLRDKGLIGSVSIWLCLVLWILYGGLVIGY
ncbi:hypothetical protein A2159_00205, partial [Candidatus Woesebacteria bacterium RBG_13_34_9]